MSKRVFLAVSSIALATGCGLFPSQESPQQLAETLVAQTQMAAAEATARAPTETATSLPTETPTEQPTATPPRSTTPRPAGPVSLTDDFSRDSRIWFDCDYCSVEQGELRMGPFPVPYAYEQQWALCEPCGMVRTYRLAVDVKFVGGPSERGFGLVLNLNENEFYTYEVTPWQTVDFWHYHSARGEWSWINGVFSGSVRTGNQYNRIEIEAAENATGRIDYSLGVNGRTPLVIFNRAVERGWVGLTLYGHAVELTFDNFEFETEETPEFPPEGGRSSG